MEKLSQIFQKLPHNLDQAKNLAHNFAIISLIRLYWTYAYHHDSHNAELLVKYLRTANVSASENHTLYATFLRDQVIQNSQGSLTTDGIFVIPNTHLFTEEELREMNRMSRVKFEENTAPVPSATPTASTGFDYNALKANLMGGLE